ncbi:MAG TPA: carbamoyl-phosphate synthase large subunit, partial [Pseudonocardiaceae bacterium]|nr:carbamoyl-phosphate synthase large subunit [Pseudonocardiaceae bacterium]
PRFAFEKFPGADPTLTTTMKSVGEAMSLGRSFPEALGKALRSMETSDVGFWTRPDPPGATKESELEALRIPHDGRLYTAERALRTGATVAEVAATTGIDPWFVDQIAGLVELRAELVAAADLDEPLLRRAKRAGISDRQLATVRGGGLTEADIRALRVRLGVRPVYKTVDTCAAEFAARTPYHYSAYESDPDAETEVTPQQERPKVIILGSGPNRIGQGIEFDYSCVHAALALRAAPDNDGAGYETVMVNCNPETVSTDYDTSDRLYFEPLTFEDVLEVIDAERASGTVAGVIVQLGGQTPLGLAQRLADAGVPVVGTPPEAIHLAEDRGSFGAVLEQAGLPAPAYGTATSFAEARKIAEVIGYPVLVRPSYVLGGRGMEIVYDEETLAGYITRATEITPEHPVLVDRFLDDAIEIDVDALCDGTPGPGGVYIGGIMEHIEEAGVHSGDSACALPPIALGESDVAVVRASTEAIAHGIGVRGLLNVQYALKDDVLYVLEANPRASRTVPFVSKTTAVPLAKAAARIMLGASIAELRAEGMLAPHGDGAVLPADAPVAVKEAVLPFHRFRTPDGQGVDSLLGPEMKSTGEVMGIDAAFGQAFAKSQAASYGLLPTSGRVFVSVANRDKRALVFPVKRLADLGFEVLATQGTANALRRHGIPCTVVRKHFEGPDPARRNGPENIVDLINDGRINMIINTPYGNPGPRVDGYEIRTAAVSRSIPCITTVQGAAAAVQGIEALIRGEITVRPLQALHTTLRTLPAADHPG